MYKRAFVTESVLFLVFSCITLAFLFLQAGLWAYLDDAFYIEALSGGANLFADLFTFNNSTLSFGADKGLHNLFRLANKIPLMFTYGGFLPLHIGQGITMLLILMTHYLSVRFLAKELGSKHYVILGLFYAFNPISLYLLNQSAHALVYSSFPLILYAVLRVTKASRIDWVGILLLVIGVNFLLSYPRATIIYTLLLIVIILVYLFKNHIHIDNLWKKFAIASIVVLMTHLFVFNNIFFLKFVDSAYTSGPGEYAKSASVQYGPIAYRSNKNKSQIAPMTLNEITQNYNRDTYATTAYKMMSLLLFVLFLVAFITGSKRDKYHSKSFIIGMTMLIGVSTMFVFGKFVSEDIFIAITYKWLLAFQNNTNWIYLVYVIVFLLLINVTLNIFDGSKKKIAYGIIIAYILSGILPMLNFTNVTELHLVNPLNMPEKFSIEFFNQAPKEASIHYPKSQLIFNWAPYPVSLGNYSSRNNLLSNNKRLVTPELAELYEYVTNSSNYKNFALLNLKYVFVHKKIKNNNLHLPYYTNTDLVEQSKSDYDRLISDKELTLVDNNEEFAKFSLLSNNDYDFRLYTPLNVNVLTVDEFTNKELKLFKRPVIVPTDAFRRPVSIADKQEFQNVKVAYKRAHINTNAYYMHLSNVDKQRDVLLQLNQTFNPNWKVYFINKKDFDAVSCINQYRHFSITDNDFCLYDQHVFTTNNLKLLQQDKLTEARHFEGNFIGNGWLLKPRDLQSTDGGELYVAIVYQKQIYFMITLFIALITFIVILLLAIRQYIIKKLYHDLYK